MKFLDLLGVSALATLQTLPYSLIAPIASGVHPSKHFLDHDWYLLLCLWLGSNSNSLFCTEARLNLFPLLGSQLRSPPLDNFHFHV